MHEEEPCTKDFSLFGRTDKTLMYSHELKEMDAGMVKADRIKLYMYPAVKCRGFILFEIQTMN